MLSSKVDTDVPGKHWQLKTEPETNPWLQQLNARDFFWLILLKLAGIVFSAAYLTLPDTVEEVGFPSRPFDRFLLTVAIDNGLPNMIQLFLVSSLVQT